MSSRPNPNEHSVNASPRVLRFDVFELDLESGELRKAGTRVRLQAQPTQLLTLLLENPGKLVTRDDIRHELWPADTFVDFDRSLATAVNKIREALGDSAENPTFVETLPKRGYRFIAEIEPASPIEFPTRAEDSAARTKDSSRIDGVKIVPLRRPSNSLRVIAWILVGALAASAIALFFKIRQTSSQPTAWTITQFTSYPGLQESPAFSPDGSRIAFIWDGNRPPNAENGHGYDLYVKGLGAEATIRLTNRPSQFLNAAWSPDGTRLAFMRLAGPDTGLYVVSALGGTEKKIRATRTAYALATGVSWSPDGDSIAYSDRFEGEAADRIFVTSLRSGENRLFFHDRACKHEANLTFSHDGKQVAWLCVKSLDRFELLVGDSAGNSRRVLARFPKRTFGLQWDARDEHLVLTQTDAVTSELYEVSVNDGTITKRTEAGNNVYWPTVNSRTGAIAWTSYRDHVNMWRADLTEPGRPLEAVLMSSRNDNMGRYSPDGKHIAFDSDRSGTWKIWLADPDGRNLTQLSQGGPAGFPQWSPDSRKVAYHQVDGDAQSVYVVDIEERAPKKLLTKAKDTAWPFWSADGKWIYFQDFASFRQRYYRCSMSCNQDETLAREGAKSFHMQPSPDGQHWYHVRGDEPPRVYRETVEGGSVDGAAAQVIDGFPVLADAFLWTPGKNGIYFVAADKPKTISYFDFATGTARDLFTAPNVASDGLSVPNDEKSVLVTLQGEKHSEIMLAEPQK
jgi:Tol biopolymer transport system component/DNA-binding winged helix-turn-helix (wHTH) protein